MISPPKDYLANLPGIAIPCCTVGRLGSAARRRVPAVVDPCIKAGMLVVGQGLPLAEIGVERMWRATLQALSQYVTPPGCAVPPERPPHQTHILVPEWVLVWASSVPQRIDRALGLALRTTLHHLVIG